MQRHKRKKGKKRNVEKESAGGASEAEPICFHVSLFRSKHQERKTFL